MVKYEILDKIKLVDAFDPKVIIGIILDPKLAKHIRDLLLAEEEQKTAPQEPKHKGRVPMSDELREAKKTIRNLELKVARYKEVLDAHDLTPRPGRRRTDKDGNAITLPPRKKEFKSKMCPGFGSVRAHLFTPTAGNQKMCPECRRLMLQHSDKHLLQKPVVLHTTMRGGSGVGSEHVPTIEEVLDMLPGEERTRWEERWSPEERRQAQIIKNKREMERIRKMRHKGFDPDDPIMGINAQKLV